MLKPYSLNLLTVCNGHITSTKMYLYLSLLIFSVIEVFIVDILMDLCLSVHRECNLKYKSKSSVTNGSVFENIMITLF